MHSAFVSPRAPYHFDGIVWSPNLNLNYRQLELAAGYQLVDSRRLRLAPFVGLAYCEIVLNEKDRKSTPALDRTLTLAHPLTAGLCLDVKMLLGKERIPVHRVDDAIFVRLRGGWRGAEARSEPTTSGGIYFLELGLGGFVRQPGRFK
jgi:hypothetical protein